MNLGSWNDIDSGLSVEINEIVYRDYNKVSTINLGLWSYIDSCQSEHEKSECRLLSSGNHHGKRNLQSFGGTVPFIIKRI